jgi:hypothetical protein
MPSREAWVERSKVLLRERGEAQALKVEKLNCLIQSRECFVRLNICNQSKWYGEIKYWHGPTSYGFTIFTYF